MASVWVREKEWDLYLAKSKTITTHDDEHTACSFSYLTFIINDVFVIVFSDATEVVVTVVSVISWSFAYWLT